ncbi:MAG TPA: protein-L-isoaspartate(D-aspartate) O-methyltransferase [Candidatus Kapabacteria bacterium]|nr:protein-L-isoaspartate(D-aspartate) O-methyltransferase [Candidatus Kapabacteria bacterium]
MFSSPRSSGPSQHAAKALLDDLRAKGITDERVLQAIARIPREEFVPPTFRHRAYDDDALPIACAQTISQPYTVAMMSQLLEAKPDMSVLEIGTGSGYQAAVLYFMGLRVFTVERHAELLAQARERLERIGANVASHLGDGTLGWSQFAPYDRIMVTAGAPQIPSALLRQLAPNGRLVVPVGGTDSQSMKVVTRRGDGDEYDTEDAGSFKFVPLIGRGGWSKEDLGGQGGDLPAPGGTRWFK